LEVQDLARRAFSAFGVERRSGAISRPEFPVPPITIAQMLGHSSTQIVPRYAQVMDQNRLDAMKKLEELEKSAIRSQATAESAADEAVDEMRQ